MKVIGVVSMIEDTCRFLKQQLDRLFDGEVQVNRYTLSAMNGVTELREEQLLIFPGNDALREGREKLSFSCPALLANRSLNYQRLDEVFGLPEGSEVYVLNDFKSSAYDAVRLFETLGLNQFRYIPFYPGAKDDGVPRPLITFGPCDEQYDELPRHVERIIDVGIRTIDISTIVEIMLRLGLPEEKMHQVTAKYVKDLIALMREINHLNHNNESMRRELETVVQTVDEGIITLDAHDNVLVFNAAAEKIFNLSSVGIVGRKISSLPSKLIELLSYAAISAAGGSGLYDYYGKSLAISLSEVSLGEAHAEKVYMIREVMEIQKLEQEVRVKLARKRYTSRYTMDDILGGSEAIRSLKKLAGRIAVFDQPVYIYGESGTGKELFAQAIHACSRRANGPFVAVNFAAMSESLLESELFGYADGAFTGAKKGGMPGVFEQAHGGTLFLDEIGDSPLSFQIKLLRVLQEKQVRRIGDDKLIPVNVRVIVATNKDIAQLVREGRFREDLYYRLNVLPLHLLPLRERRADILPLAREFYCEMAPSLPELPPFDVFFAGKLDELMQYDFPGNARQLRNVVEFLVCTSENGTCPDISPAFGEVVPSRPRPLQDEQIVLEALREREKRGEASGRRSLAAMTGLSEDRVKKALAILRENGSVEIRRGRSGIVLRQ